MSAPSKNPYRQILRRRFPEPFIALLAFLMGVWLWDHYFAPKAGYEPGTDQLTLIKMDRDYRLAEAMSGDPAWLRWMVGVETPAKARQSGMDSLKMLDREGGITTDAAQALLVGLAEDRGEPILQVLRQAGSTSQNPDLLEHYEPLAGRLMAGEGRWWERSILRAYAAERPINGEMSKALKTYDDGSEILRQRAIISQSIVWGVILLGTLFIPITLKRLCMHNPRWRRDGYAAAWTPSLGLVVFLAATLAWIGFSMAIRAGFTAVNEIPNWLALVLDSAMRLLPTMIAVGLLFRRPLHAIRIFGLNRPPAWALVFGSFALLCWANEGLVTFLQPYASPNPTGGLGAGEAGWWGLFFGLVSACLIAPIAEETLYRGVLFRSLANRMGIFAGALISSAAFALVHIYDITGLVTVGLFGLTCALLFASTGSLTTAVVLHLLYNAAIKIPEWTIYHSKLQ